MTTSNPLTELAAVLEKQEAATPGPWSADDGDCDIWGLFGVDGGEIAYAIDPSLYGKDCDKGRLGRAQENIAAIVVAVNYLRTHGPDILALVEAAGPFAERARPSRETRKTFNIGAAPEGYMLPVPLTEIMNLANALAPFTTPASDEGAKL